VAVGRKIVYWLLGIFLGVPLLLVLAFPLISMLAIDGKYENFAAMHPKSEKNYSAELPGAQPTVACGGTAGKYNWGEQTRSYQSLNGSWEVAEGALDDVAPTVFPYEAPVPGLLNAAEPAIENIGLVDPARDAFWYRHSFFAPEHPSATALLCLGKAKYGVRAWLNGTLLGDHYGAFTQAEFDLRDKIRWGASNELVVRLGAERSKLPAFIPAGQDHEKTHWIPGIWDDVNLLFTGEQTVVRVKVETDIHSGEAVVFTTLRNNTDSAVEIQLSQEIREWRGTIPRTETETERLALEAAETRTVRQSLSLEDAKLWTLETPSLYVLNTRISTDGGQAVDDRATRFGFREVQWKGGDDKGFYLNGDKVYLRGSNISLHRFVEDPLAGDLAWQEAWVRKLLTSYPRQYHWNILRTSIGRLPNFWYDIADEEGLLIDDEFAYWSLAFPRPKESKNKDLDDAHLEWSIIEMEKEFTSWIQENWNHPAIAMWSASNETVDDKSREIIDRVRYLDGTRQWENGGWQKPHSVGDPIEDHPYIFAANFNPMTEILGLSAKGIEALDKKDGQPIPPTNMLGMTYPSNDHAHIINEYGWLWLNRDGTPTKLTANVYQMLLGDAATPQTRREAYAYLHAGLTGFWRAKRGYQGVQHFSYLNHSKPGTGFTSDNFIDLENLVMEPRWHEYHRNVWSPVAVYIDQWRDNYKRGGSARVPLIIINDFNEPVNGTVEMIATAVGGEVLSRSVVTKVRMDALGQQVLKLELDIPDSEAFVLYARLRYGDGLAQSMVDRRKVGVAHPGVQVADLPDL
jgi:beta-galactosidase